MQTLQKYALNYLASGLATVAGTSLPAVVAKIVELTKNTELTGTQKRAEVEAMVIQGAVGFMKIVGQLAVMLALAWAANNGKISFNSDGTLISGASE